jgi:hypothetical protein
MGSRSLLPIALIAALGAAPAWADPPTVRYRLQAEDAFQEGCFEGCACPIQLGELEGTFLLRPAGTSSGFETWTLSGIDWLVPQTGAHLTGSGLYRRTTDAGPDVQQRLTLDLSLDGGPLEHYDSGLVPVTAEFPVLDVSVSMFDLYCWDRLLHVRAVPSWHPIAFRFDAEVTSVFDGLGALGGSVAPGDTVRGFYVFDPATPNTAEPVDEGTAGLYHHDRPPAGVRMRAGHVRFYSDRRHPDFDIVVNDEIGFAGADEYGFVSLANDARGLESALADRIDLSWLASTIAADPLSSADLPLTPPDLALLGGGLLTIYGECTPCAGPAAFFRIEATLTSLTRPAHLWLDGELMWWERPQGSWTYEVVSGDLDALRATGGFAGATEACLTYGQPGTVLEGGEAPAPGQAFWFVARPVDAVGTAASYDSPGPAQESDRDEEIAASGYGCP